MSVPSDPAETVAGALAAIDARIAAACQATGRARSEVTLVAVSKTRGQEAVQAALAARHCIFGENRVQEAAEKFAQLRNAYPALRLHLIGPIQTNKAELALRIADTIETLDRPRLADALQSAAERLGRLPALLIQVNIGDEPQKAGIPTAQADPFIAACMGRFGTAVQGLMCIPPASKDPSPYFAALAAMAERHQLPTLSMGMSSDFETAIKFGATHVRVGSAIFGARPIA